MMCRFLSGACALPTLYLSPGRHLLGRAQGVSIKMEDPAAEPHHAILDLDPEGGIEVIHISGGVPILLDGRPLGWGTTPGREQIPFGRRALLTVGESRLSVSAVSETPWLAVHRSLAADPAPQEGMMRSDVRVVREPRHRPKSSDLRVVTPVVQTVGSAPAPAHSLIAAGISLAAGLGMAVLLGHMMFAAFAVMGACTALATWVVGRFRHSRQRHKAEQENLRADRKLLAEMIRVAQEIEVHLHHSAPEVSSVKTAHRLGTLWARRPDHGDAFEVNLGLTDRQVPIQLVAPEGSVVRPQHQLLVDQLALMRSVPEVIALDREPVGENRSERPMSSSSSSSSSQVIAAVTGPVAAGLVRSVVMQLAVGTGPADLRIVAVTSHPDRYVWVHPLPHAGEIAVIDCTDSKALSSAIMRLDDGDPRRLLLITDAPELLTFRTGPVRRLLDLDRPITLIAEVGDQQITETGSRGTVPAVCTTVIRTDLENSLGIGPKTALEIAMELSGLEDPEDASLQAHSMPTRVDLRSLTSALVTPGQIAEVWRAGGADPAPIAVIGRTADALLEIDLVADGPHGLVAGTTGSGKSELLRSLVISLALRVSPEHLQFVLIDYKGGSTFDACADLPHTVGVVTDLDEGLAERALISLEAELHRRERILRAAGAGDLRAYRAELGVAPLARLLVVIDEFAALAKELPGFLAALVGIAQRGRSLGVHLILATQRPAGVIDDAIRANTDLRIALRLNDAADARDVVNDDRPVGFPRGVPGRSLMRLGADAGVVFQAASSADILRDRVDAICEASRKEGHCITHRPWLPSLDEIAIEMSPDVVGVIDDPGAQTHRDLRWDRSGGLALIGALGSGTTSTMLRIIELINLEDQAVVYIIDAAADPRLSGLDDAPNCAGVIGVHDRERVERLMKTWSAEIDHRQQSGKGRSSFTDWVMGIDGLMGLRRSLDDVSGSTVLSALERILAEGPAVGLIAVATVEAGGAAAASMVSRLGTRWVHHLEDPAEGALYGIASAVVPPCVPGRIRIPAVGLFAQIHPPTHREPPAATQRITRHRVTRIGSLPSHVCSGDLLPASTVDSATKLMLTLGIGHEDLGSAHLEVTPGDHVLLIGPARSGRSTAAAQIVEAWLQIHNTGKVLVICGRPSGDLWARRGHQVTEVTELPRPAELSGPLLVIVDDAERVEDLEGRLVALVESGDPRVLVVAVGRPDALRGLYGHWTVAVRRSRTGLVMAASGELDGDLFSVVLPRRSPVRIRPGLAWLIDAAGVRLAQLAVPAVG